MIQDALSLSKLCTRTTLTYSVTAGSLYLGFALEPLNELLAKLPEASYKRFLHTDQGWQYRHKAWQRKYRKAHLTPSMSRRATCLDNAWKVSSTK